jgi:hypothetical protein
VLGYIERGKSDGATLLCGGERAGDKVPPHPCARPPLQ